MERFPCPGCMTMLTVVDTPNGRRLAGQVTGTAKPPAPTTPSPAKRQAEGKISFPQAKAAVVRPAISSPLAKPFNPSRPFSQPNATAPRSVPQHPSAPGPRSTGGGNAGIIFGVAILVLFAVTVGVVASFRDGGLFGSSDSDAALEVADSKLSTTDADIAGNRNEVAVEDNSADPMAPDNNPAPVVNPPNMASPEMANRGGSTPAPRVMTPPSTPSTPVIPAPSTPVVSAPMNELTTQEIVKLCEPSVARITTQFGSLGTGFVVGPQLVATNEHVVGLADPAGMTIRFPSRGPDVQFRRVELAYSVKDVDLVLLKVSDMPADYRPLNVARISDLDKGEPLLIIGNPGGLTNVVTQGLFGSVQRLGGSDYLQLSMSINQGNSGGPALTAKGQVAGVVTLKSPQEGIGLAIPGDIVKNAVQKVSGTATADIAQNVAWWRARQTGTKLLVGCKLSADLVRLYNDAARRGGDARAVNMAARRNGQLIQQVRLYRDDLNASLRYVAGSDLPEQHKQIITQLDNAFQQLSRVALSPPTSGNQLRNAIASAQRVPQLEQQLKSTLGVMNTAAEVALEKE